LLNAYSAFISKIKDALESKSAFQLPNEPVGVSGLINYFSLGAWDLIVRLSRISVESSLQSDNNNNSSHDC